NSFRPHQRGARTAPSRGDGARRFQANFDSLVRRMPPRSSPWISCLSWIIISILTGLAQLGCDRGSSSVSSKSAESPASRPTTLVPLTNMVLIKAGSFLRQKYPVTLTRDFWIGRYEVTQGEYEGLMGNNPSRFQGDANRPVEKVRYLEALAYCSAVTKR